MTSANLPSHSEHGLELTRFGGHPNNGNESPPEGVHMAGPGTPYAPEFRAEAVRIVREGGRKIGPGLRSPRSLGVEASRVLAFMCQYHVSTSALLMPLHQMELN